MNFTVLWLVSRFCGLILAQDHGNSIETEILSETMSSHADMSTLLIAVDDMREKLRTMETRLKDSENLILELQNKERTKVIFSATVQTAGAIGPFNMDTTLIYGRVLTNIGNAYSQSTGIFVAPVAGVYYFSIFFHAGGEHEARLLLYKNNELTVMTHDQRSDLDSADNGGNAVFLQLQQGDQVFVQMAAYSHVWGYNHQTSFSGFLVTEM